MKLFNGIVYRMLLVLFLVFVMLVAAIVVMMSKRGSYGLSSTRTTPKSSERIALELVMTTTTSKTTKRTTRAGDVSNHTTEPIDTTLEVAETSKHTPTSATTVVSTTTTLTPEPTTTSEPTTTTTTPNPTTTTTTKTTTDSTSTTISATTTTEPTTTTTESTTITTTPTTTTTTTEPTTTTRTPDPTTTTTMKPTTTTSEPTTTTTPTITTTVSTITTTTLEPTTITTTTPESTTTLTPTTTTTEPTTTVPKIQKLVYAHVLYRTGATGMPRFSDQILYSDSSLYQRGRDSSESLGDFLKSTYVDTGFLSSVTADDKIKWVSRELRSCFETSEIVMNKMFDVEHKWKVKVDKSKTGEFGSNDFERPNGAKCKAAVSTFQSLYRGCLGTDFICMLEERRYPFSLLMRSQFDVYTNKTGRKVDGEDPRKAMNSVAQFEVYKNYFDNDFLFKAKYFDIITPLLEDLRVAWESYKMNKIEVKFNVFSTEDWIMLGILKAFNVFGDRFDESMLIEWNSLIMIELWDIDGNGFVKFNLKRGENSDKNSIIEDIHNKPKRCENSDQYGCPIEIFLRSTGFEKINMDELCKT